MHSLYAFSSCLQTTFKTLPFGKSVSIDLRFCRILFLTPEDKLYKWEVRKEHSGFYGKLTVKSDGWVQYLITYIVPIQKLFFIYTKCIEYKLYPMRAKSCLNPILLV